MERAETVIIENEMRRVFCISDDKQWLNGKMKPKIKAIKLTVLIGMGLNHSRPIHDGLSLRQWKLNFAVVAALFCMLADAIYLTVLGAIGEWFILSSLVGSLAIGCAGGLWIGNFWFEKIRETRKTREKDFELPSQIQSPSG